MPVEQANRPRRTATTICTVVGVLVGVLGAPAPAHAADSTPHRANAQTAACAVPSTHDPKVIKIVYEVGTDRAVSAKVLLAAFEAGWVESHMNNLDCGDRDSVGVFQQRPSMGWCDTPAQCMDVTHASNRFYAKAQSLEPDCGSCSAGQLAQRVQVSAFPERYDQAEAKARSLIEEARSLTGGSPAWPGNLVGRSGMAYNGAFHMMLQGSDNTLLHHIYRPEDGWQPVRNAGGTLASKPRLIGYNNAIQIFARGTDNTVKYRSLGLNGWSNEWRTVPGAITGTPALATVNNTLYVLARVDTTIRYRYLNLNGWNSDGTWRALGSPTNVQIVSDPTTAVFDNRMYVMALGSDNRIWVRMLNPANDPAWSDWYVLPGTVAGTPTAAVRGDTLLVFARGPQNDVRYHLYHKGDPAWITDRTIHGTTQGDPSAISTTNNTIHVYTRDTQNNIVYRYLNDNCWNDNTTDPTRWRSLGQPTTTLDSNPITISHGSAIHVAARSTDTNLYIRSIDANGWTPWTRLTGNHAPLP